MAKIGKSIPKRRALIATVRKALLSEKAFLLTELPIDGDAGKARDDSAQWPYHGSNFIDAQHIGGCDDLCALDARGGLDLYFNALILIPSGREAYRYF